MQVIKILVDLHVFGINLPTNQQTKKETHAKHSCMQAAKKVSAK